MIVTRLQGGIGNQLFQWAYSYKLSKKHDIYFDKTFYTTQHLYTQITDREFSLDQILSCSIPVFTNTLYQRFVKSNVKRVVDNFHFHNFNPSCDTNYYLDGYWQSEKYFLDVRDEIINMIDWSDTQMYSFSDSCSIHVRRGDYLKKQHVHPIQPLSYFDHAIDIIQPRGNIFVFSDDIDWCKSNLKYKNMIFVENNNDAQDLKLMSQCSDNIISNSSFSWWGAWLNKNPDKRVVCPKNWFADNTNDTDIKPMEWMQI